MFRLPIFDAFTRILEPITRITAVTRALTRGLRLPTTRLTEDRIAQGKALVAAGDTDILDKPISAVDVPGWVRVLAEFGLCKRSRNPEKLHVWLVDQKLLYTVWCNHLAPTLKIKLSTVCGMFCDKNGGRIDWESVSKHGAAALSPLIARKLARVLLPA